MYHWVKPPKGKSNSEFKIIIGELICGKLIYLPKTYPCPWTN